MREQAESGQIPAESDTSGAPRRQRKLRAQERRDMELAAFCDRMVKESRRSDDPARRRDASYWADLAGYYRATAEYEPPKRAALPNTRRLEFLDRAGATLAGLQVEEVGRLRFEGMSWQAIGEAVGITRQSAQKRWAAAADQIASALRVQEDRYEWAEAEDRLELDQAAADLEARLGLPPVVPDESDIDSGRR